MTKINNIEDLPIDMIYQITHDLNYNDMVSLCDTNKDIKSLCDDTLWKYKTNHDFKDGFRYLLLDNENYQQRYLRIAAYNGKFYRGSENHVKLRTIASNMELVLPDDYDYFLSKILSKIVTSNNILNVTIDSA